MLDQIGRRSSFFIPAAELRAMDQPEFNPPYFAGGAGPAKQLIEPMPLGPYWT